MKYLKPKIKYKKIKISSLFHEKNLFDRFSLDEGLLAGLCFLPDTKILMSDKKEVNIEKVKIGDKVFAYDLKTGSLVEESVAKVFVHPKELVEYFIINGNLKVTGNHPVWVNGESWKRVDELKVGDWLLSPKGEKIVIHTLEKKEEEHVVYNLGLDGPNNNYFAESILAHNRTPCACSNTSCAAC